MYLIGDLSDRAYFQGYGILKIKKEVTKDDLIKLINNSDCQAINLETLEYYDPDKNEWLKIEREAD